MTISERIFERLRTISMTQKTFSELTGIQPSTISEWKKKKTNPSSDKIMAICHALNVTPEWLLSGADPAGGRSGNQSYYIIGKTTDTGRLIHTYNNFDQAARERLIGYVEALNELSAKRDFENCKRKHEAGTADTEILQQENTPGT